MTGEPLDRGGVEQVGAVFDVPDKATRGRTSRRAVVQDQRQVELGRVGRHRVNGPSGVWHGWERRPGTVIE